MNIFAGLQKYATKFQVKETRVFNAEELADVVSAKVVAVSMVCQFASI